MKLRGPSLFWRTFLLLLVLIIASLTAWLQSFRVFERAPRAQTIAQQVTSVVNVTRAAVVYADPDLRRQLLAELAKNESVRIYLREPDDAVEEFPDSPLVHLFTNAVKEKLGSSTQVAAQVNGVNGVWISLNIDDDAYWVFIERDPLAREYGTQWIGWAGVAMLLSIFGAVIITRLLNRPLAELSSAARKLGAGNAPDPLPETGASEIRTVNESFNRMVADLAKLDSDRNVLLAGISHDLRTPLARLRLEIELAPQLDPEAANAMVSDIEQMDAIVKQFLDYARSAPQQPTVAIDFSALVEDALRSAGITARPDDIVTTAIEPGVTLQGYGTELTRAADNLIINAQRYGHDAKSGLLNLSVSLKVVNHVALLSIADTGPGIAARDLDRLLRPFERGEAARTGSTGTGLGLPIVLRIARMHGGELRLLRNSPHGLRAELWLPMSRSAA